MSGPRILISAASAHGSTEVIAEEIGCVLTRHGLDVTVLPPERVTSVVEYDAFVIGSAVYVGHWLAPAKDLADRFGGVLASRPVWLFSSGPVGNPAGGSARAMAQDPVDLAHVREVTGARDHQMFAGSLDPKSLSRLQRASLLIFRGMKGDFRDWGAIREWADAIARDLLAPAKS